MILEQYVTDQQGKRVGIILPIEQYEKMMADLHDLVIVAERRQEQSISLSELTTKLGVEDEI